MKAVHLPRHCFYLLDRDQLDSSDGASAFDVPIVVGEMLLYGKQTDRDARIVFFMTKNDVFEDTHSHFKALLEKEFSSESE